MLDTATQDVFDNLSRPDKMYLIPCHVLGCGRYMLQVNLELEPSEGISHLPEADMPGARGV